MNEGQTGQGRRNPYWDSAKALLIFLVILGHMVQYMGDGDLGSFWSHPVFKGIYMFHMPLFMLMSGYFAAGSISRRGWGALPRYAMRLMIPCAAYGFLRGVPRMAAHGVSVEGIYGCFVALWFVVVVMECLFFCLILMGAKNAAWRSVWCVLPLFASLLSAKMGALGYFLFPHAGQFSYLWPFFLIGVGMKSCGMTEARIRAWHLLALPVFAVAYIYFEPTWYVYREPLSFSWHALGVDAFRTLAAVAGCVLFLRLAKYVAPWLGKSRIVLGIGRATLAIYLLQCLCFDAIATRCGEWIRFRLGTPGCIAAALALLLAIYGFYSLTRRMGPVAFLLYGESFRKETGKPSGALS